MQLRKLALKDVSGMLEWMHDPDTNRYFTENFAAYDAQKVSNFVLSAQVDGENVHRACVDDNDNYLGTISLKHIDRDNKNAEYAVSFRSDARGTGATRFATEEILKTAFEKMDLQRVYLNVLPENERANAFYRKMGFVYEGCFRKTRMIRGALRDLNWYSILKSEWQMR